MTRNQSFPVEISWKTLLQDCGMRPEDVLRRAGLPADLFTRPDLMLPTEDYFRFWRRQAIRPLRYALWKCCRPRSSIRLCSRHFAAPT